MANTGLVTIDVTKSVDITSNNNITIDSTYGNVYISSVNGNTTIHSNNAMLVKSNTSIAIVAPAISANGYALKFNGESNSVSNTIAYINTRLANVETKISSPGSANTDLATRGLLLSYIYPLSNTVNVNHEGRIAALEAGNFGDASNADLQVVEWRLANQISNVATTVTTLQSTLGTKNRTYVLGSAPGSPTYTLVVGDLWFDSANGFRLYRWNGSAWVEVADGRFPGILADITTIQTAMAGNNAAFASQFTTLTAAVNTVIASVNTGIFALANDVSAQAGQISTLSARMSNTEAWVQSVETALVSQNTALVNYVNTLVAATGAGEGIRTFVQPSTPTATRAGDLWFDSDDNFRMYRWNGSTWQAVSDSRIGVVVAGLATEQSARADADSAMTSRIDSAFSRIANSEAWIRTTQTTLASQTASLASQIQTLQVTAGSNTGAVTFVQSDAPSGAKVGDLWFDSDDSYKLYRWTYNVSGNTWTLVADSRIASAVSNITNEQTARIANDSAMTTRIDSAFTRIGNAESWITTVQNNLAGNNAATASSISTLSARVYANNTTTSATSPPNPANGDLWFDSSSNNLLRRWNGSAWLPVDDGRIAVIQSSVTAACTAIANLTTSVATLTTNVNSRFATNEATISGLQTAMTNQDAAFAQSLQNLTANVGSLSANVSLALTASANASNGVANLQSQAQLVVNAGKITGFKATSTSTLSEFIIQADRFKIQSSSNTGAQYPFSVIDGITYINNAVIQGASIDTDKLAPGSISRTYTFDGADVYVPAWSSTIESQYAAYSPGGVIYYEYVVDGETYQYPIYQPATGYNGYPITTPTATFSADSKVIIQGFITHDSVSLTSSDEDAVIDVFLEVNINNTGWTQRKLIRMGVTTVDGRGFWIAPLAIAEVVTGVTTLAARLKVRPVAKSNSIIGNQNNPSYVRNVSMIFFGVQR